MSQLLSLKLPDDIYELLLKTAEVAGQKPDKWIVTQLSLHLPLTSSKVAQASQQPSDMERDDDLLALAGTLESDITDIGEQHDLYIGQALLSKLRRK